MSRDLLFLRTSFLVTTMTATAIAVSAVVSAISVSTVVFPALIATVTSAIITTVITPAIVRTGIPPVITAIVCRAVLPGVAVTYGYCANNYPLPYYRAAAVCYIMTGYWPAMVGDVRSRAAGTCSCLSCRNTCYT
jgi:hypothetical protein